MIVIHRFNLDCVCASAHFLGEGTTFITERVPLPKDNVYIWLDVVPTVEQLSALSGTRRVIIIRDTSLDSWYRTLPLSEASSIYLVSYLSGYESISKRVQILQTVGLLPEATNAVKYANVMEDLVIGENTDYMWLYTRRPNRQDFLSTMEPIEYEVPPWKPVYDALGNKCCVILKDIDKFDAMALLEEYRLDHVAVIYSINLYCQVKVYGNNTGFLDKVGRHYYGLSDCEVTLSEVYSRYGQAIKRGHS